MELHLKIVGCLLVLLSAVHIFFPTYFKWKMELASLSLLNKQMMYVHTFFVSFIIGLMGFCCICSSEDIIHTRLGHQLALGLFLFWFIRLLFQFFIYSARLWKGKSFETFIHVLFSILWSYFSLVFFLVYRST